MKNGSPLSHLVTVGELLEQLGGVAPQRVRLRPAPGKATEADVLRIHQREKRLYELVDNVLVEKVMGLLESRLACDLIFLLKSFLGQKDTGFVTGPDGALRLMSGLVRIPDVSFISWDQLPHHEWPKEPIPDLAPDLAVEVLSEGNTPREMERKVREYFFSGTRLVWLVDPAGRSVRVCTAPDRSAVLTAGQVLDGGDVLPGLALSLEQVFANLPPVAGPGKGGQPGTRRRKKR
jgi:Uma2 family endonuclease